MTEQQANHPIDDLFRQTFENLPDTPAASGWDKPSEQVWQHIQSNIQPANKTWNLKTWFILAGSTMILAFGLYWLFAAPEVSKQQNRPENHQPSGITPLETSAEQPDVAPQTGNEQPAAKKQPAKTTTKPLDKPETTTPSATQPSAQPLPGSKTTLPPNSTEAQKKEGANSGENML
jgi:hypothetical protein